MTTKRFVSLGAAAVVLALALAGCGDGSSSAAADPTSRPSGTTTTTAPAKPARQIDVTVPGGDKEFSFETDLTSIPAGAVQLNLTNRGSEVHQAVLLRFKDGVDMAAFGAAAASDATGVKPLQLVDFYGGPNEVATGATASSTQIVTPGNYVMLCLIPGPDHVPHAAKGMIKPFTVTPSADATDDELDPPDASIAAIDFGFQAPGRLPAGGTARLTNKGKQAHEAAIVKLNDGVSVDQFLKASADPKGDDGVSLSEPAGGIVGVSPGGTVDFPLPREPGKYLLVCYFPDTAGSGQRHVGLGMVAQVNVS